MASRAPGGPQGRACKCYLHLKFSVPSLTTLPPTLNILPHLLPNSFPPHYFMIFPAPTPPLRTVPSPKPSTPRLLLVAPFPQHTSLLLPSSLNHSNTQHSSPPSSQHSLNTQHSSPPPHCISQHLALLLSPSPLSQHLLNISPGLCFISPHHRLHFSSNTFHPRITAHSLPYHLVSSPPQYLSPSPSFPPTPSSPHTHRWSC